MPVLEKSASGTGLANGDSGAVTQSRLDEEPVGNEQQNLKKSISLISATSEVHVDLLFTF